MADSKELESQEKLDLLKARRKEIEDRTKRSAETHAQSQLDKYRKQRADYKYGKKLQQYEKGEEEREARNAKRRQKYETELERLNKKNEARKRGYKLRKGIGSAIGDTAGNLGKAAQQLKVGSSYKFTPQVSDDLPNIPGAVGTVAKGVGSFIGKSLVGGEPTDKRGPAKPEYERAGRKPLKSPLKAIKPPSPQRERPGKTAVNGLKQAISKKTGSIGQDISKALPPASSKPTDRGSALAIRKPQRQLPPSGGVVKPVQVRDVTPQRKALPPSQDIQKVTVQDLGPTPRSQARAAQTGVGQRINPQAGLEARRRLLAQKRKGVIKKAKKGPGLDSLLKSIRNESYDILIESMHRRKTNNGSRLLKAMAAAKEGGAQPNLDSTTPPYWGNRSNQNYGVTSGS